MTVHLTPAQARKLGTPCRVWRGYVDHSGYGIRPDHRRIHVWVWEQINGPVPKGMKVCHHCDNPPCYRYDHLWLGTQAENLADMRAKGRGSKPPIRYGERHHTHKLTDDQVRAIRRRTESSSVLGREYGVSSANIRAIRRGETWSWLL